MSDHDWRSVLATHAVNHAHARTTGSMRLSERQCDVVEVAAFRDQTEHVHAFLPQDALRVAPDRWLVIARRSAPGALAANLARNLAGIAAVADQSSGYVALRLSGVHVRAVLAKSCRLDLAPEAFPPGACARTIMAQIPVLVSRPDLVATFGLFVPVTLVHAFAGHLLGAAAEFGIVIETTHQD